MVLVVVAMFVFVAAAVVVAVGGWGEVGSAHAVVDAFLRAISYMAGASTIALHARLRNERPLDPAR